MSADFSKTWWGAAWVAKMETLAEPRRFADGRKYAMSGRVKALVCEGRLIAAKVQGSRETPYSVRISFDPFSREQWDSLFALLPDHAGVAAALLRGELPLEVKTAFGKAKLRFMPERYQDLYLECACPDWLKPCKHLAAVWLKFAREFDRDPFLLFQLRGLERGELFALLQGNDAAALEEPAEEEGDLEEAKPVVLQSLPSDPAEFWSAPALPPAPAESPDRPLLDDDLLEKLGQPPFSRNWWALKQEFRQVYDSVYEMAALMLRNK
jgi:uncharacterized Zn finger protein